ncbi:precorrin-6y C5,15-methyltransferase (decarboxylating) subunit CbiE [Chelativorans sp. ZYF759]|uniref:precorrin-6y C5,15-methyltransferase (decarboxylating) subunit CbiE n=1 Tax=Chelativorans sp. ZYF759 TaxID=2692213 RepID=UPI00145FC5F5|nr:precorrin-6y C5,15-methyltransferase (decarboxylating) subunit CbiE [Chelativorans sp. ZYF759]NMG38448.1 precorrin-6y C5,15-methyltransferase (decarboxylating) subunit CbiE [Chelativorans sp. ZYF759]
MSSSEQRRAATSAKWLSIVGIGEDGVSGLGETARRLICDAEIVFGGKRHLALAESLIRGEAWAWPSPFSDGIQAVQDLRGRRVCVLASGDPFLHGVGATLARDVAADEMDVVPAPSAFSLAAARLGWPLAEIDTVSLHGRPVGLLRPLLHPGRRILALTSDAAGPAEIAAMLRKNGFGKSLLTLLEALGGPDERVRQARAAGFDLAQVNPLNLVAIEAEADADQPVLALAPGLPDDLFDHDGQITKREMRATTLSALAPRRGELLWDIGAGSGSVAIEWMLQHPSLSAIAIESHGERAARISGNAEKLGVPGLRIVEGKAPDALSGLPAPDAIFVGGGGSRPGVMEAALDALKPGGRLVANAVTLEMETVLLAHHARLGGELIRLSIQRAEAVGSMTGWRPAMPVMQWAWTKPRGDAP